MLIVEEQGIVSRLLKYHWSTTVVCKLSHNVYESYYFLLKNLKIWWSDSRWCKLDIWMLAVCWFWRVNKSLQVI